MQPLIFNVSQNGEWRGERSRVIIWDSLEDMRKGFGSEGIRIVFCSD